MTTKPFVNQFLSLTAAGATSLRLQQAFILLPYNFDKLSHGKVGSAAKSYPFNPDLLICQPS
jgi:hypothetical protein